MKTEKLTFHRGADYACIMRPQDTTETPLAALCGDDLVTEHYGRLFAAAPDLLAALKRMAGAFRPFTMKPIGAPGSAARADQDEQIAAHAEAMRVLAAARGEQ
jgi:hypothetical protein